MSGVGFVAEASRAKIRQPYLRTESTVDRFALMQRLGHALLHRRVVLVQALAGYGKSCSVSRALDELPGATVKLWISLDEADTVSSVVECLVLALEPSDVPWRNDPASWPAQLAPPDGRSLRSHAATFMNALAALDASRVVLVFDDLHRVADPAVFHFMELLVEQLTERWTLVFCSRTKPPFSLARVAASGEMEVFREPELSFSADEARQLCRDLPAETAGAIWTLAGGWPAGIRLAMNAGAGSAKPLLAGMVGSAIFEFLIAEVIDTLPEELRRFLLQLAVLPEVSPWLAEALTENPNAPQLLDQIERQALFVADVGGAERVLKFHELFRESLNRRLMTEPGLDRRALLRRAAELEQDAQRRIAHWLEAHAWPEAAAALAAFAPEALSRGQADQAQQLLSRFPVPVRETLPALQFVAALLALERWDWAAIAPLMKKASLAWRAEGDSERAADADSYIAVALAGLGDVPAARARLAETDNDDAPDSAARQIRLALARSWLHLAEGELGRVHEPLGLTVGTLESHDAPAFLWKLAQPLPAFIGLPGTKAPLLRWIQGALRRTDSEPSPLHGMALVIRSWLAFRAGDRDGAWTVYDDARGECAWLHDPAALSFQLDLLKAQLLAADRRSSDLAAHLTQMLVSADRADRSRHRRAARGLALYLGCRAAHQAGERTLALQLGRELLKNAVQYVGWIHLEALHGIRAICAGAEGDSRMAFTHWQAQVALETSTDLFGQSAEARLNAAALALERADGPYAEALVSPVLLRCRQDDEPALMLLAPQPVLARIFEHTWSAAVHDQLEPFARRFSSTEQDQTSSAPSPTPSPGGAKPENDSRRPAVLAAGLSKRELEVLVRIAKGESNKHIARYLDLSPFTVKRHVGNILTKLDLGSRGQASAWYRDQQAAE
ncbi:LuxR C-terminal-related transcriptional regulator [Niveibacterium sp. SC-1]|uniref:helix-turn-helix transcriptional regulator n=1 Tax=Niveibacterium sp. SC-1 TaxID=3135646 RepID=UPI00311D6B0E